MPANRSVRSLALFIGSALVFGCTDNGTAPNASLRSPSTAVAFRGLGSGQSVRAVRWLSGSSHGGSVSATIGAGGGTLSIPGADFTIVFPRGALARDTRITIVASSNGYVSYEMLPHGLQFAVPVTAVQGLDGVEASDGVFCAYLPPGQDIDGNGSAAATEIEASITNFVGSRAVAQVWTLNHFSRYILASGATSSDDSSSPPAN